MQNLLSNTGVCQIRSQKIPGKSSEHLNILRLLAKKAPILFHALKISS